MHTEDLLATCWTTAGAADPAGADQRSPLGLRERAEAASAAGFRRPCAGCGARPGARDRPAEATDATASV
ncbi:hypothetical protein [Streptomyces sp. NPDC002172]